MPYSAAQNVVYGPEARTLESWARVVLCTWLQGVLNDVGGPYRGALGISDSRLAIVSDNPAITRPAYVRTDSPPIVIVKQGPLASSLFRKTVDGTVQEGKRFDVILNLDMGIKDASTTVDDFGQEHSDDETLAGFVADALRRGMDALGDLGLFNLDVDPDAEMLGAGRGRHPMKVTFFCRSLETWSP